MTPTLSFRGSNIKVSATFTVTCYRAPIATWEEMKSLVPGKFITKWKRIFLKKQN